MPRCSEVSVTKATRRVHVVAMGLSSSSGAAPSMTSVPQVSALRTHSGTCARANKPRSVTMRSCSSTHATAVPSSHVAPYFDTVLKK